MHRKELKLPQIRTKRLQEEISLQENNSPVLFNLLWIDDFVMKARVECQIVSSFCFVCFLFLACLFVLELSRPIIFIEVTGLVKIIIRA